MHYPSHFDRISALRRDRPATFNILKHGTSRPGSDGRADGDPQLDPGLQCARPARSRIWEAQIKGIIAGGGWLSFMGAPAGIPAGPDPIL